MTPGLRDVWKNIRELGLGAMQHALRLSFYHNRENQSWSALSVLSAAHSAELLIKARIAQEHPLLIFETTPKARDGAPLDFELIASEGRTFQYSDLPARLWAATGTRIRNEKLYREFGRLRNTIQHFAEPNDDLSTLASAFIFEVVDPFIGEHWGLFAIDYNEEYGDHYEHIFETLVARDIRPRLSPTAIKYWKNESVPKNAPTGYRKWFERALKTQGNAEGEPSNG